MRFSSHAYFENGHYSFCFMYYNWCYRTMLLFFCLCLFYFFGNVDYRLSLEILWKQSITDVIEMSWHIFSCIWPMCVLENTLPNPRASRNDYLNYPRQAVGHRSDVYFPFRKLEMVLLERLDRSMAQRPGFAENRTEETSGSLQGKDGSGSKREGPKHLIQRSYTERQ